MVKRIIRKCDIRLTTKIFQPFSIMTIQADRVDLSSETDKEKDLRFAKWLSKTKKLQGIPPSVFFSKEHKHIGEPFIRFCFIKVSQTK